MRSATRISLRTLGLGVAERLPFTDASVDAALAILTIPHWQDQRCGLDEVARISRGPIFPTIETPRGMVGRLSIETIAIPADCVDGFLGAYWHRPEAYLDPDVRSAISTFSKIANIEQGAAHLRADLQSGAWRQKHGHLLQRPSLDVRYRLVKVELR